MTDRAGWQIEVETPAGSHIDDLESLLAQYADAVSTLFDEDSGDWRLTAYCGSAPDRQRLIAAVEQASGGIHTRIAVEPVQDRDWVGEANSRFLPFRIGRFHVHGSHVTEEPPDEHVGVRIDAGQAFGTGHHESTAGCLRAFESLYPGAEGPGNALDLGTGTGILAISLARAFGTKVLAADIDAVAVETARNNVHLNGVSELVTMIASDGLAHPRIRDCRPFDLIVANIVERTLTDLAPGIAGSLAPQGYAVLSGLLRVQGDRVSEIYSALGLEVGESICSGDWVTLVLTAE